MMEPERISPQDAASWLRDHGWEQVSPPGPVAALWRRGSREVLLPLRPDAVDFERRVGELVTELSIAERKVPELVQLEINNIGADICEWRAEHPNLIDDSIPLSDAEILISEAKNAFVAAASATMHRRGYFGHSVPHKAREHARVVRMGHTQRGSYIVPIISRVPDVLEGDEDALLPVDGLPSYISDEYQALAVQREPFGRQVMDTLVTALARIQEVAEPEGRISTRRVNEAVGDGVSYELCTAISNALRADSVASLAISFSWSRRIRERRSPRSVEFPKELAPAVDQMSQILRGSPLIANQTIVGSVYSLRRDDESEEDIVVIRAAIGGDRRRIRLRLPSRFRHDAALAYDEGQLVFAVGQLSRHASRSWEFNSITDFGLAYELPVLMQSEAINGNQGGTEITS